MESRYFCWAPYDAISLYRLEVVAGARRLGAAEIATRYRRPAFGRENRSIQHLKDIVSAYESTYGRADHARVKLYFQTNGDTEQSWTWPLASP